MCTTTATGGGLIYKTASIFTVGAAALLPVGQVDAASTMDIIDRWGVRGVLVLIAIIMWRKMEKQEEEVKAERKKREADDAAIKADLTGAIKSLSAAVGAKKEAKDEE